MVDTNFLNESLSSMWNCSVSLSHPLLSALITHSSWAWIKVAVFASACCHSEWGWVQQSWGDNSTGIASQSSWEAGEQAGRGSTKWAEGKQEVTCSYSIRRTAGYRKHLRHFLHFRGPPFWCRLIQTLAGNFCPEILTGRKSEAFRPMGSFLAAGITDGSVLVKGVEEAIGGLWTGSGCRRNWDKNSSSNSLALVWCSFPNQPSSHRRVLMRKQSPVC